MGFFFAAITAFSFASSNVLIRKGMKPDNKDNGMLMTVFINAIFLALVWVFYRLYIQVVDLTWQGTLVYVVAGLFTTFIGRVTLFGSIRKVGPSRGTAIKNSAPIFTILFAVLFLGETLSWLPLIGVSFVLLGLAIQGYYMVRQVEKLSVEGQLMRAGYFLALASALSFGFGQGVRKLGLEYLPDPYYGAFISATVALVLTLAMEAWQGGWGSLKEKIVAQYRPINYYFVGAGLFTSVAVLCFFVAMTFIQVSYVSVIVALEPILTIILSKLILKREEEIKPYTILAACTVFAGVIMIISFG